jgi:transposase
VVMKHYPAQFKADAVALYRSRPGATIAQIADDLGGNRETLRSWVRADDRRRGATAGPAASAASPQGGGSVEEENALRRQVRELEEERDILRETAQVLLFQWLSLLASRLRGSRAKVIGGKLGECSGRVRAARCGTFRVHASVGGA